MIRVGDLSKYHRLKAYDPASEDPDEGLAFFANSDVRRVTVTFNAPYKTPVYIRPLDASGALAGEEQLLAVVEGLQPVEFTVRSAFVLWADADVWMLTAEGSVVSIDVPDAVSTIRPFERRPVHPEIQQMQEMLLRDQARRFGPMMDELDALRKAVASRPAPRPHDEGTPSDGVAPVEPQPPRGPAGEAEPAPSDKGTGGVDGNA